MGGDAGEHAEANEADITEDIPTDSRQYSSFVRRTRQNKIRKVVREVYLRDDVAPETFEGADMVLVLDTNMALHQLDFIAEDECINHVVVPYTVLNEVRHRNKGTFARLRALCRLEVDNATDQKAAVQMDSMTKRGHTTKDMSNARNARQFYVFPNEFFRETYVERNHAESINDRNDRAIRRVAHWYRRHVVGPEVLLLTDDRGCKAKALADGLAALTAREFVEKMKIRFPDAGEKLAMREEQEEHVAASGAAPRGQKRKSAAPIAKDAGAVYPAHLKASEVEKRLKERTVVQGVLRMHMSTCTHASVVCGEDEFELSGRVALNRAFDGDIVAVERLDDDEAEQRAEKKLRREADTAELGTDDSTPSATAELLEASMALAKSLGTSGARPKGRVVGIIKRNWREYCGTLRPPHQDRQAEFGSATFSKADRVFIPTDARVPNVVVQTRHSSNLDNKRIVVVLDGWDRYSHSPRGHWTTILGEVGDRNVESAVILHEHGVITREFSEAVLRCLPAGDWTPEAKDLEGREDLRGICACSVDPPGCKDIDDAVSCEELPNGNFRVGVHIADVTHFVHPDTPIDLEAAERCTTVYLVERRTDMLPSLLTTDLCSLVGGVERCCFTVLWEMTKDAEIVNTHFCKAIIKSRAALSYAEAQARIDDTRDNSEVTIGLRHLLKITQKLHQNRLDKGALVLASAEVKFELDSETQDPTDVAEYTQRETNKLIEEMMLLANQAVATKILDTFPMFSVLRRHPPPKDEALKTLRKLLLPHDMDFKFGSNKELSQSLADSVKPNDPYFNHLVRTMATRCMNQAVYFCTGEVQAALHGHYGLAMEKYTHFTSPIRRYADVLVHRLLAAAIGISPLPTSLQSKPAINEQCDKINIKHRMAQWAGRASNDLHTFMFFNKKGPQSAQAVVTRIRRSGMQVTVQRFGIEGIATLPEEDWDIREDEQIIRSRKDPSIQISIFSWVMVHIEADNSEFRNRTKMNFESVVSTGDKEAYEDAQKTNRQTAKEMYPDRLVQEAN